MGNCDLGDKTYLDTLVPTTDVIETALAEGKDALEILDLATQVSADAAEATRPLIAKRSGSTLVKEASAPSMLARLLGAYDQSSHEAWRA